jgi:hypothetical protein
MFTFESGRKGPTGPGIYAFRYPEKTLFLCSFRGDAVAERSKRLLRDRK